MKKYTIVLSDDEGDKKDDTTSNFAQPSSSKPRVAFSGAPTAELMLSCTSNMMNSRDVSATTASPGAKFTLLERIHNEQAEADTVRTPIPKSDDEIRYWIMTSRSPCLFHHDDNAVQYDLNSSQKNRYQHAVYSESFSSEKEWNYNESFNVDTVPSNGISFDSGNVERLRKHNITTMDKSPPVHESFSGIKYNSTMKDSFEEQKTSLLNEPNVGCKRLSSDVKEFKDEKLFKADNPKIFDDYDSGSSVLTINYIHYANDKSKINRKSKSFNMSRRRDFSNSRIQYIPEESNNNSNRLLKHKSLDENRKVTPLGLLSSKNNHSFCEADRNTNVKERKLLSRRKDFFKPSLEEMKRKNEIVFDTSKTSSSSIENSFSDKQRFFKKSFKEPSDEPTSYPLSKIENNTYYSDYGSVASGNGYRETKSQAVTMSYTKVETHFISNNVHNTESTYSAVINYST